MANVRIQIYFASLCSPGQEIILCFSLQGLWFCHPCGCITLKDLGLLENLKFIFGCFGKEGPRPNSKADLYFSSSKKPSGV